jgi:hypothetical protein
MSNWWVDTGGLGIAPGEAVVGGGGDASVISPRSPLDAARMANGFAPGASYPDGYLGTITDRQQDKLLGAVQGRMTDRSYQRGVHKGEKLGQDSYYWTADCNPDAGIARQSMAQLADQEGAVVFRTQRHVPTGDPVEKLTALGKSAALPPEQQMEVAKRFGVDPAKNPMPMTMTAPDRVTQMQQRHMLPTTR